MRRVEFRFIYNRKGQLNKDGKALVQLEIYQGRKRKFFSTGIYLTPKQWDTRRQVVKNHTEAQRLNWLLRDMMNRFQDYEIQMIQQHGYVELSMFDNLKDNETSDFWEMFEKYHETQDVSISRRRYIKRTIKYWKEFNPKLTFKTFNLQTIYNFDLFLRQKGLHTNTILQHHKVTQHFLNVMVKSEIIKDNPYTKYSIKREKTERTFLTEEELNAIAELEIPETEERLILARDMFLFSCYTGLRFSDVQALKPYNIEKTDGVVNLKIKQQKTGSFITIPVSLLFDGKALTILEKYKGNGLRIFPKASNQDINRQLKIIKGQAGIQKELTFHVARHTFGTLLAKYTHDPYLIKELMGHGDIRTSMVYIHLNNEHVTERLKRIKWE